MPKKIVLDVDDKTWKEVKRYKLDNDLQNNNKAVVKLLKIGLKTLSKSK